MGFDEERVHRGTSCVGFDLNALLSWLCPDGETIPAEQASAASRCVAFFCGTKLWGDGDTVLCGGVVVCRAREQYWVHGDVLFFPYFLRGRDATSPSLAGVFPTTT